MSAAEKKTETVEVSKSASPIEGEKAKKGLSAAASEWKPSPAASEWKPKNAPPATANTNNYNAPEFIPIPVWNGNAYEYVTPFAQPAGYYSPVPNYQYVNQEHYSNPHGQYDYQGNHHGGKGGARNNNNSVQNQSGHANSGNISNKSQAVRVNGEKKEGLQKKAPAAPPAGTAEKGPQNKVDAADGQKEPQAIRFGTLPPGGVSTERATEKAPVPTAASMLKEANEDEKDSKPAHNTSAENQQAIPAVASWSKTAASVPPTSDASEPVTDEKNDNSPLHRGATVSPKNGGNNALHGEGGTSGWKRGESMVRASKALTGEGVYDKNTLLSFFAKGKTCPDEIKSQYPVHSKTERMPLQPKGNQGKPQRKHGKEPEEPHPDEATIFDFSKKDENTFQLKKDRLSDGSDPEVVCSKAKLILNKLSVTKFEKLSDDFMNCGLYSDDLMNRAVEMIVLKAQMEEHFCFMYADLCRKMTDTWVEVTAEGESKENSLDPSDENSLGRQFRAKLLSRCQQDFSTDRTEELEKIQKSDEKEEDKEEKTILLKKRYTGHMRFVGELYLKDLVSAKVMHFCIKELLGATEEETLVCLIKLLTTVGSKLENYDRKKNLDNFGDYFSTINDIHKDHKSSRMRYMLFDLIDLRKDDWKSRNKIEKAVDLSEIRGQSKGNKGNSPRNNSSSDARGHHGGGTAGTDEWTTVQTTKKGGSGKGSMNKGFGSKDNLKDMPKSGSSNAFGALASFVARKSPVPQVEDEETRGWGKAGRVSSDKSKGNSIDKANKSQPVTPVSKDLPGADGTASKEVTVKVRAIIDEYYMNQDDADALLELKETIDPNAMGQVIGQLKGCIDLVFEKYPNDRSKFCKLLTYLHTEKFLTSEQVKIGVLQFLDNLDESIIDSPLALIYGADILASLLDRNLFDMSVFCIIPDENNFSMSFRRASFLGELLSALVAKSSTEKVAAMYVDSKLDVISDITPEPKQSQEDAVSAFLEKHSCLTFLK